MAISSISAEFKITDETSAKVLAAVLTSSPADQTRSIIRSVLLSQEDAVNVFKAIQNKSDIS